MRDFCAIYDLPSTLPVDVIHHTRLAMAVSCKRLGEACVYFGAWAVGRGVDGVWV